MDEEKKTGGTSPEEGAGGAGRRLTSSERQALYAERAASRGRAKRIRALRKTAIVIAAAALALAAAVFAAVYAVKLYKTKILPERRYGEAVALAGEGKFFEAADIMSELGDWSDARELAEKYVFEGAKKVSGLDDPLILDSKSAPWFSVNADGALSFNKDVYAGDGNIRIPAVFERTPVTALSARIFFYADFMLSVEIPMTVTVIGERAFYSCESLSSVTIPDSVKEIGASAFASCAKLESISFGSGLKTIGDRAFKRCDSLTSAVLPEGLEAIGPYAFNSCLSLASVSLPASLKTVANYAFTGCDAIKTVSYPGTRAELEALCKGIDGVILLNAEELKLGR
ncbi:MAG: leucine-rich repeat domain-containing protein [Clostridia bacterium]|nr:leucine-rich repeat domain-containing protein [Clostridia bacterium]